MENPHQKLVAPKKKKRCFQEREAPFPVPIASITGVAPANEKWCYYTGQLIDNHVEVCYSGDMDFLHKMGFFGKGNLSRHDLAQNSGRRIYSRKGQKFEGRQLKVISRRKYLRRLKWQQCIEGKADVHPDLPTDKLPIRGPAPYASSSTEPTQLSERVEDGQPGFKVTQDDCDESHVDEGQRGLPVPGSKYLWDDLQPEVNDPWGTSASEVKDPWGDSEPEVKVPCGDRIPEVEDPWGKATEEESAAFWGVGSSETASVAEHQQSFAYERNESKDSEGSLDLTKIPRIGEKMDSDIISSRDLRLPHGSNMFTNEAKNTRCYLKGSDTSGLCRVDHVNGASGVSASKQTDQSDDTNQKVHEKGQLTSGAENLSSPQGVENVQFSMTKLARITCTDNDAVSEKGDAENEAGIDPRCLSDHEDGSLFVVNDTDESDTEMPGDRSRLKWEPAVKRNPFLLKETLHLTFEEAFFLSYGLGCLVVLDNNKKPMKLSEMWRTFGERQSNFLQSYIAYHNFRSKGWVPKPGIKFGGDFVIYKEGPPFYHSTYVVMVRLVDGESLQEINTDSHRTLTWTSLAGQNRITEQASKELMICYVIQPKHLSAEELKSPRCIPHFKIQEMRVRRWLLKHERENIQYMEIP